MLAVKPLLRPSGHRLATPAKQVFRLCPLAGSISRLYTTSEHTPQPLRACPSCSAPLPLTTTPCPKCNALIPLPEDLSLHSLLGLSSPIPSPPVFSTPFDIPRELSHLPANGFALNTRDLRNKMLARQRDLHPDKFQGRGRETELAIALSGRINKAYETLGDPLRRAEYLLSLHQLDTAETDSLTEPGLLMDIMEAREELESAMTVDKVEKLRDANTEKIEKTIQCLTKAFEEVPPNLAAAKVLAVELKYWMGLEEAAKEWSPKL